ncbi:hypothetical protein Taro_005067 [Colocasia esculenta]|uniref:Uncharacterized protein n=1 Tax=Colocasia esculenta TaxID=4460 RepID=A0A843TM12_COLES|nr:hypothetical protein [Colocasia esculenta]
MLGLRVLREELGPESLKVPGMGLQGMDRLRAWASQPKIGYGGLIESASDTEDEILNE